MVNKRCKLAQKKYKTSFNWVGKGIHWELCKRLKFDYTNKWYLRKPKSVLEKWDEWNSLGFWEIHGSSNFGLVLIIKKKECHLVDFAVPGNLAEKRLKIDKYLDFTREVKKNVEYEGDGDTTYNWCDWNGPERLGKGTERLGKGDWKNRKSETI